MKKSRFTETQIMEILHHAVLAAKLRHRHAAFGLTQEREDCGSL
jgi:hypothetical protein